MKPAGGAVSVTVIIVGNEISNTSNKMKLFAFHNALMPLGKA